MRHTVAMDDKPARWSALDAFRGLTVFLMLPVNAGMEFDAIPAWLKHAPGAGMNLADFIMPAFLVAMGLSSSLSLKRRAARDGRGKAALHALARSALLFGFGSIGYLLVWKGRAWEVLQMLGLTGALALPFLFLPPLPRVGAAFALGAAVELLRPAFFDAAFRAWYDSGLGGPWGAVALARVPILASAAGELLAGLPWKKRFVAAMAAGDFFLTAGLVASSRLAVDKHLLTAPYLLIAMGAAFAALALMEAPSAFAAAQPGPPSAGAGIVGMARRLLRAALAPLGALGRNPLFGYMAGGVLTLLARALVPADAPPAAAWAATLGVGAAIVAACLALDRRGLWLRL